MHAFHTRVCIVEDGFRVFLGIASQCMRSPRMSAFIKTAFAFIFVLRYNVCVSHACLRRLKRFFFRFPLYGFKAHVFHKLLCIG